MQSRGRTEINIGIGQVGSSPGISFSLDILIGQGNTSELKHEIHTKTGQQFEDYNSYILIQANSEESAHALQQILQKAWTDIVQLEDTPYEFFIQIQEIVRPYSYDDPIINSSFSVLGSYLVVKVSIKENYREWIQRQIGFFGPILEHDQNVHVELDIEKSFRQIFHSEKPVFSALDQMKLNVVLGLNTALSSHGASIAENMGAPSYVQHALGLLSLYKNAFLDLKFLSAEKLPQKVNKMAVGLDILRMFKEMKEFVVQIGEYFDGEIQIVAGFSSVMMEGKINVPGLFQAFNDQFEFQVSEDF